MELLSPGLGLIIWQTLTILSIPCFMIAWLMILFTEKLGADQKMAWLIGTLFLPVLGPIVFFAKFPFFSKARV